ncbi:cysteine proteinase inhibitor 4-like [Solanum dulcamara]|uniref:cysteine proteinase inhibitor 4-like n=1 Tax=Solanum dulcamara TaxID=45834 RepID=UPI002485A243|nr:cysteine proteinase inhibitor 4-like [Solanum dulcamara]
MRVLDEQQPIDPNDPNVVGIAKFAVDERNKEAKTNFELVKVNAGGTNAILDGTVYQLDISVTESQISTTRLVAVLVHSDGSKELISFE